MFVFDFNGTAWNQAAVLEAPEPKSTTTTSFGADVDFYDETVIVGEPDWMSNVRSKPHKPSLPPAT